MTRPLRSTGRRARPLAGEGGGGEVVQSVGLVGFLAALLAVAVLFAHVPAGAVAQAFRGAVGGAADAGAGPRVRSGTEGELVGGSEPVGAVAQQQHRGARDGEDGEAGQPAPAAAEPPSVEQVGRARPAQATPDVGARDSSVDVAPVSLLDVDLLDGSSMFGSPLSMAGVGRLAEQVEPSVGGSGGPGDPNVGLVEDEPTDLERLRAGVLEPADPEVLAGLRAGIDEAGASPDGLLTDLLGGVGTRGRPLEASDADRLLEMLDREQPSTAAPSGPVADGHGLLDELLVDVDVRGRPLDPGDAMRLQEMLDGVAPSAVGAPAPVLDGDGDADANDGPSERSSPADGGDRVVAADQDQLVEQRPAASVPETTPGDVGPAGGLAGGRPGVLGLDRAREPGTAGSSSADGEVDSRPVGADGELYGPLAPWELPGSSDLDGVDLDADGDLDTDDDALRTALLQAALGVPGQIGADVPYYRQGILTSPWQKVSGRLLRDIALFAGVNAPFETDNAVVNTLIEQGPVVASIYGPLAVPGLRHNFGSQIPNQIMLSNVGTVAWDKHICRKLATPSASLGDDLAYDGCNVANIGVTAAGSTALLERVAGTSWPVINSYIRPAVYQGALQYLCGRIISGSHNYGRVARVGASVGCTAAQAWEMYQAYKQFRDGGGGDGGPPTAGGAAAVVDIPDQPSATDGPSSTTDPTPGAPLPGPPEQAGDRDSPPPTVPQDVLDRVVNVDGNAEGVRAGRLTTTAAQRVRLPGVVESLADLGYHPDRAVRELGGAADPASVGTRIPTRDELGALVADARAGYEARGNRFEPGAAGDAQVANRLEGDGTLARWGIPSAAVVLLSLDLPDVGDEIGDLLVGEPAPPPVPVPSGTGVDWSYGPAPGPGGVPATDVQPGGSSPGRPAWQQRLEAVNEQVAPSDVRPPYGRREDMQGPEWDGPVWTCHWVECLDDLVVEPLGDALRWIPLPGPRGVPSPR